MKTILKRRINHQKTGTILMDIASLRFNIIWMEFAITIKTSPVQGDLFGGVA